jgi:hypothetical protein
MVRFLAAGVGKVSRNRAIAMLDIATQVPFQMAARAKLQACMTGVARCAFAYFAEKMIDSATQRLCVQTLRPKTAMRYCFITGF